MSKVAVRSIKHQSLRDATMDVLNACNWERIILPESKVVIKLNLCAADPGKIESSCTSPDLIKELCTILLSRTHNITLVESNGYRYVAEKAFEVNCIYELGESLGIPVISLSKEKCRNAGNELLDPLPEILLDAEVFITMPVLKTHALTYFTGALKNQWGCVPQFDRISLHWALDELIVELQRILKPSLCIMDGIVGQEGRGPVNGKKKEVGIVLASTDAVCMDATAMRLVGLDPAKARHVVMAHQAGLGSLGEDDIDLDMPFERFWGDFEPAQLDWAVRAMNRLSKYKWFRYHILEVEPIFQAGKKVVQSLRKVGIVR